MADHDSKLKANPQGIALTAKRVRQAGEDFENLTKTLKSVIAGLENEWQGRAQRNLASAFSTHEQTFTEFRELIESYAKELENYANELLEVDQNLSRSHRM